MRLTTRVLNSELVPALCLRLGTEGKVGLSVSPWTLLEMMCSWVLSERGEAPLCPHKASPSQCRDDSLVGERSDCSCLCSAPFQRRCRMNPIRNSKNLSKCLRWGGWPRCKSSRYNCFRGSVEVLMTHKLTFMCKIGGIFLWCMKLISQKCCLNAWYDHFRFYSTDITDKLSS